MKRKLIGGLLGLGLLGSLAIPGVRDTAHAGWHRTLVALALAEPSGAGQTFWCPMHPEIRRAGAGTCPI